MRLNFYSLDCNFNYIESINRLTCKHTKFKNKCIIFIIIFTIKINIKEHLGVFRVFFCLKYYVIKYLGFKTQKLNL